RGEELAALLGDPKPATHDRLGGCCAETDEQVRPDDLELQVEPGPAGANLGRVGSFVESPLAAGPPLEVLDDVADEDPLAVDARFGQGVVEDSPGWTHERPAREGLTVARLPAHEHQRSRSGALAEDGLRRPLPEVACLAARRRPAGRRET